MVRVVTTLLVLALTVFTGSSCVAWPALLAAAGLVGGEDKKALLLFPMGGSGGGGGGGGEEEVGSENPEVTTTVITDLVVDTDVPDGYYPLGSVIEIRVKFLEDVNVTGTPRITLNNGIIVDFSHIDGGETLVFTYSVGLGDDVAGLDYDSTTALDANGGTVTFVSSGEDADLTLSTPGATGSITDLKNINIDTTAGTITNVTSSTADGSYGTGAVIDIQLEFDEIVVVTGTPTLDLNTTPGRQAAYVSGSGTATLTFQYTVTAGDDSADLDYATTSALTGTITDLAMNPIDATLPAVGATGSLGDNKDIVIDTTVPVVRFVGTASAGLENVPGVVIPVTLSSASTSTVTVNYAVTGGTATTADYTLASGTLTFAPADISEDISLTILEDVLNEADETVQIALSSPTNASLGSPSTYTYTIQDNDPAPDVTLGLVGSPLAEAGGTATVTATLSTVSGQDVTVNLAYSGTATNATDYGASSTTILILAGSTSGTATLTGIDDATVEASETIIVDIASVTNGNESGVQQVTASITDDDVVVPNVTLSLSGSPFAENAGTTTVTATLSATTTVNVTVNLAYSGTATNTTDYTRSSAIVTIPAGSTTGTVTLTSVDDTLDEVDETVIVDIASVTNGTESGTQQITATITDDDAAPDVTLSLAGSPLAENAGVATVTATLSAASAQDITINLAYSGTATNTTDYTRSSAVITILAGNTTGTVTLTGVDDTLDEVDETVIVDIASVTNGTESGTQQVTATINDDDAAPDVTLSLTGSPLAENAGVATVTATLSAASAQDVTINLTYSGTATNATDYTRSSAVITILAGSTTGTVTLTGVDDATIEGDETIIVDIASVTNGTESGTQQVTATITDDDATPDVTLSLTGSPLAENAGVATVTATLSAASAQDVTINLAYSGTATNTTDYTRSSAAITILAGSTTGTVTLTGVADTLDETDETVIVDIASVTNGTESGTQQVTATITDDDAAPDVTLSLAGSPLAENAGVATVTATLSAASSQDVTINLAYSGTATDTADYTRSSAVITILAGSTTGTVTLTGVDDTLDEPDETVIVDIASVTNGTESGTQQVTATITDDDAAPDVTLSLAGSPLAENAGVATVTATLSAASSQDVTINLAYSGTATNTTDYTRSSAIITIIAGSTTGTITLTGVDDALDEADETVIVDIASVTNGTESGTQQVTATITDDDAAPDVTLSLTGSPLAENAGVATVAATLSAASSQDVTINLAYSGTATDTADYTRSSAVITILAGSTTGTVTLTGVDDTLDEADETVIVDIASVTNGTESGTQQVTATITDDDAAPDVTLSLTGSPLAENAGVATVTATLSAASSQDVTINLAYSGTATDTTDYTRSSAIITILASNTTGTVTLTGVDDTLDEADETVIVDIASVTNGTESGTQQVTATITDDDAAPDVTLSLAGSPLAENAGVATITATLSAVSAQDVTINLAYSGTATNATDYTQSSAIITILAGNTTGTVTLTGVDDALDEADETVIVDIASVTNGTESGTQQVTATITDDDATPDVTLSLTGSPLAENAGVATVTATLSAASSQDVTINLAYSGTATDTADYTRSSAIITILAGSTTGTVTLTGVDDTLDEVDETVVVDIASVTNGTESGTQQVTATITDDDAAPDVTLSLAGSPLAENAGVATVTATLSAASSQDVTINLAYSGTATNTTDYTRSSAIITILAGNTTGTVTLTGVDDALDEVDETVVVDIASVTNGTESGTQQVTATITDDDAAPDVTLSLAGSPLAENAGVATVTATLSAASSQDVTINLAYSGTATDTTDYSRSSAVITILAGSTTGTVTLTGVDDATIEGDETVIVDIASVTNGTESGTQQVTATITDDDAAPDVTLSLTGSPLAENAGVATVTATLSAASSQDVTINLAYSGTATDTADYTRSSAVITILAGSTTGTVTLTGVDDTLDEADETVIVDIASVTNGTESGTQQVTATITDDDAAPDVTLSLTGSPLAENAGVATVTATLSAASSQDVTINLAYSGTATNTTDYTRSSAIITILAGSTTGTITLTGVDDALDEADETVIVDIASVTNGTEIGTQQVTATITDDDAAPDVTLSLTGSPLAENAGVATVTATLSAASSQDVTINLAYSGTATDTADYTRSSAVITILAGSTTGTVTLTGVDDTLDEADETVIVDIASVTNGTESGTQQVTATITDDDAAPDVTLSLAGSPLAENAGVATVTATLSAASSQDVTINLAYSGTATDTTDYTRSSAVITILAGSTTGTVTLTGVDDTLDEADETIIVDIASVTNGTESGTQQVTATITDDDAAPDVTLSLAGSPLAENAGVATITATLSAVSAQDVTVNLLFSGTATNLNDYTRSAISITILAGNTTGTITLTGVDDTLDEVDETIIVEISTVTNGTESGTQQVTATITDDDAAPDVTLSLAGSPLAENAGVATVTATLSAASSQDVAINITYSGTATNTTDYTRSAAVITILAGSTTGTVTLTGVDDTLDEADETIIVDIASVTNGTESGTQQVTATITDDDAAPDVTLSLTGSPLAENAGVATVTATLSAASSQDVTINLAYSGTATNATDYTRSSAVITILAGSTTGTVTLIGVDDTLDEADETIIVDIASVTNGTESGTQQVTATITDDDLPPTVTLAVAGSPLAENGGVATVTATLSAASGQDVTVNLTYSGTATNTTDYTRSSAVITILAGSTTGTVMLTGVDDTIDELDETIIVDIASVTNGTESGTQQVTATITDDELPPTVTLSLSGSPFSENGGSGTVTATLSAVSALDVTVTLLYSGVATHATDYSGSASIVISAGATSAGITLAGIDDAVFEGDESIIVDIDTVTNGTESGTQQVTATLLDDELGILSAETLDADNDGQIDHYRITFSDNVNDASFPGYALNAIGSAQTDWTVSGFAGAVLAHGTAAPEADAINDAVVYLQFTQSGTYDTGAKPDLTTSATPGVQSTGGNSLPQQFTASVIEADRAKPVVVAADGTTSSNELTVAFSEAVYGALGMPACGSGGELVALDLTYADVSTNGAASLSSMGADACADGGVFDAIFTANVNFASTDNTVDTVAASATIFDAADNDGNTTAFPINITSGPVITAIEQYDTNSNGVIDQIKIVFDRAMDDSTITDGDAALFSVGGTAAVAVDTATGGSGTIAGANDDPGTADDEIITIFTDDISVLGTDEKSVSFTMSAGRWMASGFELQSVADLSAVVTDMAPPVLFGAVASDEMIAGAGVDSDDTLSIVFSEPTNKPTITSANIATIFELSGAHAWGDISSAVWNGAGNQLRLTFAGSGSTVEVGDRITILGGLSDTAAAPNTSVNIPAVNPISGTFYIDLIAPFLLSVSNPTSTTLTVRFSEAMLMDGGANAANLLSNYTLSEDPADGGCTDVTITGLTVLTQDTVRLSLSGALCSIQYRLTVASNVQDLGANAMATPDFLTFIGNEQLKVIGAVGISATQVQLIFNKVPLAGNDLPGSAGCTSAIECDQRYKISPSLGSITSAIPGTGATANTVTLTHTSNQSGQAYTIYAANGIDADGFDDAVWGAIRDVTDGEDMQASPGDRQSFLGTGTVIDDFDDGSLFDDPFGDGSVFAFAFNFGGKIYLGTNDSNNAAFRFDPDGGNPVTTTFGYSAGTCSTTDGFGTGTGLNCGTNAGPNNERGVVGFTSAVVSPNGTDYEILMAGPLKDKVSHGYFTQDVDTVLDWDQFSLGSYTGGANTKSAQTLFAIDDHLYVAMASNHNKQTPIVVHHSVSEAGGVVSVGGGTDMGIRNQDGLGQGASGGGSYKNPAPSGDTVGIDAMVKYNGRLWMANNGGIFSSADFTGFSGASDMTPAAFGTAAGTSTLVLPDAPAGLEKLSPGQRGIPVLKEYNGDLYMARNVAVGKANSANNSTNLRGELWRCAAPCTSTSDWTILISGTESELGTANAISMFEINGSDVLYVGFDDPNGLSVFRLQSSNPPATNGSTMASAGWLQQSVNGLGVGYTTIVSSTTISDAVNDYIYLTAGTGFDSIKVFRQID